MSALQIVCQPKHVDALLDMLLQRARAHAEQVRNGNSAFVDAVDEIYAWAELVGLVDSAGPDRVQAAMAQAFMGVPRGTAP